MLEALRSLDHPGEVLKEEDLTVTLPRRLGLSDVIERKIWLLRDEARRGRRVPMSEVLDLVRLVLRRPDADAVFLLVGRELGQAVSSSGVVRRTLPRAWALNLARRRAVRLVNRLFDAQVVAIEPSEGKIRLVSSDESGLCELGSHAVCGVLSGVLERAVEGAGPRGIGVRHTSCARSGPEPCSWALELQDA